MNMQDVGTYWIALFCNRSEIVYFDSFDVEHFPDWRGDTSHHIERFKDFTE